MPCRLFWIAITAKRLFRTIKRAPWLSTGTFGLQCVSINKTAGAVMGGRQRAAKEWNWLHTCCWTLCFPPFLFVLVSHPSLLKIGHILSGYCNSNRFPCTVGQRAGERWLTYCSAKAWEKPLQNISDMDQPNHVPVGHICDFMEENEDLQAAAYI